MAAVDPVVVDPVVDPVVDKDKHFEDTPGRS